MTAIFVHGVPETSSVWQPLVDRLERDDVVLLGLPGFGSALPDGFEPTMQTYADWLAAELAPYDEDDLVTHDWGAILALRVLADRPANVRSWVSDMGDLSADFEWHDTAKTWQTPGDGEALMEVFVGAPLADRALILQGVGVPEAHATEMAVHLDQTMADAILVLYRSATDVGNEWGPGIDDINAPGLLIESMLDPFRSAGRVRRLAERTGAAIATMPEAGHFWMLDDPAVAAATVTEFWATV
jgi:pimeloyl-ACP methyl ester carboxylesterase